MISQRSQYAIRAIYELSRMFGSQNWIRIHDIARKQFIPVRFLEVILNELKKGGFVVSKRGVEGGYRLARNPSEIFVGDILRYLEPLYPVRCLMHTDESVCQLYGKCAFYRLWKDAYQAISDVYDKTSFADLIEDKAMDRI